MSKMFRNILRTSRWLARREINICSQVALRRYSNVIKRISSYGAVDRRFYSNTESPQAETKVREVSQAAFEEICNETLESLCDYFEEILESSPHLTGSDVSYSDGVLTVKFGPPYGTYVINRQSPNKQIWLSSPKSGPKRYDLVVDDNNIHWVYKHDGIKLHQLLQLEIKQIVGSVVLVDFMNCSHSQ